MRVSMGPACVRGPGEVVGQAARSRSSTAVACAARTTPGAVLRPPRYRPPGRRGELRTERNVEDAMIPTATAASPSGTGNLRRWLVDGLIAIVVTALQLAGTFGA